MSASESTGEERPRREVAHRIFAAEFDDATLSYSESEEERAPNYVVTPTGARANRLFVAGVLTELEEVGNGQLRARIADPTGVFVVYAGQYQPEALAALERLDPPAFVALTGKARTFQPEDSDRVFTSIRPESISEVDAATRDRWIVETSARTLDRIEAFAKTLAEKTGSEAASPVENASEERSDGPESGIALARDHYGTTPAYLAAMREVALDAARLVAGEIEELRPLDLAPDEGATSESEVDLDSLAAHTVAGETVAVLADGEDNVAQGSEPDAAGDPSESSPSDVEDSITAEPASDEATSGEGIAEEAAPSEEPTAAEADTAESSVGTSPNPGESEGEPDPIDSEENDSDTGVGDDGEDAEIEAEGEEFEGEFDLSEEERAEIEAEYGTDFATGTEVEEPGEADIEPTAPPAEESNGNEGDRPTAEATSDTTSPDDGGAAGEGQSTAEPDADQVADTDADTTVTSEPEAEPDAESGREGGTDAGTGADAGAIGSAGAGDDEADAGVESVGVPGSSTEAEDTEEHTAPDASGVEQPAEEAIASRSGSDESEESAPSESESGSGTEPTDSDERAAEADVTEAVMDAMRELDDGDGADREAVIERVGERYGIDEGRADEAIQDALLGGQCYEPGEDRLKAI